MIFLRILSTVIGALLVIGTLLSAIQTFVLPRSAPNLLTRAVFVAVRHLFSLRLRRAHSYDVLDPGLLSS
jgi:hypothetical protein